MKIRLTECPRDAMQGIDTWIPTEKKIEYLNQLLRVGFDVLDFGSFVSPKAIPQLRDTAEVLENLDLSNTETKLLAIVANERGARDAASHEPIHFLGYPFSISETFQMRNTNATIDQSLKRVEEIQNLCKAAGKELLIYISMAFGNPYGDLWSPDLAARWIDRLNNEVGVRHIALADTVGVSDEENIRLLFSDIMPSFPSVEIGAHLHSRPEDTAKKVTAAIESGCRSFDAAIRGYGGCPMAEDDLVGNMATEIVMKALPAEAHTNVDLKEMEKALAMSATVFPL